MLLVIGGLPVFRQVTQRILHRLELRLQTYEELEGALQAIHQAPPAVLVMNLLAPRLLLDQVAALKQQPGFEKMKVILVTDKGPHPRYLARAGRVAGSSLVMGSVRLVPRLVEALAVSLGIKPRRHLRRELALGVRVTALRDGVPVGVASEGTLVNISESGAKVSVPLSLPVSALLRLECPALAPGFSVAAQVVRLQESAGQPPQLGMQFVDLDDQTVATIGRFVQNLPLLSREEGRRPGLGAEQVRLSERLKLHKKSQFKVRLQLPQSKRLDYLRLADLSESGFLAVASPEVDLPLAVGDQVEAMFFGSGNSMHCTAEVIRKTPPDSGKSWQLGLRFLLLSPDARGWLARARHLLAHEKATPKKSSGP